MNRMQQQELDADTAVQGDSPAVQKGTAPGSRRRPSVPAAAVATAASSAVCATASGGPRPGGAPYGKEVENKRISVWWKDDQKWYTGVIAAYNARKVTHCLTRRRGQPTIS